MQEGVILAIDTATAAISLALIRGGEILAESTWQGPGHHTTQVPPAIHALMQQVGLPISDLIAIAVALGPGSYTGLRVGMSLAKGIAMTRTPPLPLIGVPTLDIVAAAQPHQADQLIAITQAGRGRVNAGLYRWDTGHWQAEGESFIATWAELVERIDAPTQVAGEVNAEGRAALATFADRVILATPAQSLRRAGYLAEIATHRFEAGQVDDPSTLVPTYSH